MVKTKSEKFAEKERKLKESVIKELRKKAPKKMVELVDRFEDEARNTIGGIDNTHVYFDGFNEMYPLSSLGLLDAIYLLGVLESDLVVSE